MKKEQKRYYLTEYCAIKRVAYENEEALLNDLEEIRKFNNRKTSDFIIGNMDVRYEDGKPVLYANLYHKLTQRSTISELDDFTSKYSEKELIRVLYDKLITANKDKNKINSFYPDINIAYFEDKNKNEQDDDVIRRIKYIPVLYKEDAKYIDEEYISKCISSHCNQPIDYEFFRGILDKFGFYRSCDQELDNLIRAINKVKYEGYSPNELYDATMDLFTELINERNKDGSICRDSDGKYQISRRRLRDFGFYIKNYKSNKSKSTTSYAYSNNPSKLAEMKALRESILRRKEKEELKASKKLLEIKRLIQPTKEETEGKRLTRTITRYSRYSIRY